MDKYYQVFVSSTFTDLKEERKAIIQNLLEAKYIPAGMEMFSASNDEQFIYIKKILDTCDYYVLVISGRYGTVNPTTGISYTEQEYDYAVQRNIPILAFLYENPESLAPERKEDINIDMLYRFRDKVKNGRLCKMWTTVDGLVAGIIISLTKEISNNPRPGWSRGGEYDYSDLLAQINKLRIEKDSLEKEVQTFKAGMEDKKPKIENLANGNEHFVVNGQDYYNGDYQRISRDLTWDQIFSAVGPYLINPNKFSDFVEHLRSGLNEAYGCEFQVLNKDSAQTIKMQFDALMLINVISSLTENGSQQELIQLSDKGRTYLMQLKTIRSKN